MASFEIPSAGLHLSPHPPKSKAGTHDDPTAILRLDLVQEKTKDILNFLKAGKKVYLHTGKQTSIQYGENKVKLQYGTDTFPSNMYSRSKGSSDKVYFSGRLNHSLEVQRAREDTTKVDAALATLQSSLKSIKEEKAMNESSFLGGREEMRKLGKDNKPSPLLGGRKDFLNAKSTPGSPFLTAANSPRPGPTSAPLLGGSSSGSSKDKIRLEATKIPLIHLLASRPMSVKALSEKLRAQTEDCDRLLDKHGRDSSAMAGKKELRDKSYRELDVWKFPYANDEDRKAAIDRAVHAYDRLRIDHHDPVWQLLLPKEERGKGKVLSKLKFDKVVPTLKPQKTEDKGEASDAESKTARKVPEKRKAEGGEGGPKKKVKASSPAAVKRKEAKGGRSPLPEGKVKSSERIEDSDEEAEAVPVVHAKTTVSPTKKQPPATAPAAPAAPAIKRTISPPPKKQQHKSNLSNSSSSGDNSDSQGPKHSLKPPSKDTTTSKSPRPRHGSSPQKPSPLGSSPPTNSTDTDSSSTGKAPSQSSAPSSPPSSTEMPIPKQKSKYSPIISEQARDVSSGRPTVKRRADEHDIEPPPKRQQVNGTHASSKLANGVVEDKPDLERKISESERSSSPEKPGPVREEVMTEAKRFQLYYKKYKDFHDRMSKIPEEERDQKEMDDLLRMHKRLQEMKSEIWNNWDKVEKTTG